MIMVIRCGSASPGGVKSKVTVLEPDGPKTSDILAPFRSVQIAIGNRPLAFSPMRPLIGISSR
jgi:hypothetical protein